MTAALTGDELADLIRRVFRPRPGDSKIVLLVDLPDEFVADHPGWAARRAMMADWSTMLRDRPAAPGLERVELVYYRNARRNNAELPERGWVARENEPPARVEAIEREGRPLADLLDRGTIVLAATEFSATAPLKLLARRNGFRAASMPGFDATMIPALRLDYTEVSRRCGELKRLLDPAHSAHLAFEASGGSHELVLDLRHRTATASGGLLHEPGTAGNLPSGETYIVPYEGERQGDASRSRGTLPLELAGEMLLLRIEGNRVVEITGDGAQAEAQRAEIAEEPACANLAELGLGLLSEYGIRPVGQLLLDEKLGLHIAFGRSDHFGGSVGPGDFSRPDRVVHLDRVYLPEIQPGVRVAAVDLTSADGRRALIRDGCYVDSPGR